MDLKGVRVARASNDTMAVRRMGRAPQTYPRRSSMTPSPRPRVRLALGALAIGAALVAAPSAMAEGATPVTITMGKGSPFQTSVSPSSAKAGKVAFTLVNKGTMVHEAVILKTNTRYDKLPVSKGKASEKGKVGAIKNVAGGKTSTPLTLTLAAGRYVIICNVPGHYQGGMRVALTVKK
jgi:uncharacterized cupredoxin-like copper-binding protein